MSRRAKVGVGLTILLLVAVSAIAIFAVLAKPRKIEAEVLVSKLLSGNRDYFDYVADIPRNVELIGTLTGFELLGGVFRLEFNGTEVQGVKYVVEVYVFMKNKSKIAYFQEYFSKRIGSRVSVKGTFYGGLGSLLSNNNLVQVDTQIIEVVAIDGQKVN